MRFFFSFPKYDTEMPLTDTILWADGFILVYSITDRNSFNYIRQMNKQITLCFPLNVILNYFSRLVKQYLTDVRSAALGGGGSSSLAAAAAAAAAVGGSNNNSSSSVNSSNSSSSNNSSASSFPMVLLGNKGDMVHLRQVATEEGELFYFIPGARISVSLFPMLQLCQLVTINFLPPPSFPLIFHGEKKVRSPFIANYKLKIYLLVASNVPSFFLSLIKHNLALQMRLLLRRGLSPELDFE